MHIERFSLCAAIFLLAAPALPQSVDFNAPRMYQLGGGAYSLAVGDFNGDGKPDLVAATEQGTVMLLGNGDGTFQPASTVPNVTRRGILVVVRGLQWRWEAGPGNRRKCLLLRRRNLPGQRQWHLSGGNNLHSLGSAHFPSCRRLQWGWETGLGGSRA